MSQYSNSAFKTQAAIIVISQRIWAILVLKGVNIAKGRDVLSNISQKHTKLCSSLIKINIKTR